MAQTSSAINIELVDGLLLSQILESYCNNISYIYIFFCLLIIHMAYIPTHSTPIYLVWIFRMHPWWKAIQYFPRWTTSTMLNKYPNLHHHLSKIHSVSRIYFCPLEVTKGRHYHGYMYRCFYCNNLLHTVVATKQYCLSDTYWCHC